jgi:uncharacterized protein (TIGR02996 family)
MDEARALLKAICASPDEDTPRLVYADWLDEHGDHPRAEFIRVQIELVRIEGDDPRRPALARRERELWAAHRAAWTPRLLAPMSHLTAEISFRRGFLAGMNASSYGAFTGHAGELLSAHPATVWLEGEEDQLRAAARCPHLARVRDLGVFRAHPDGLAALLASQFATGLRGLHLRGIRVGARAERLASFVPVLDLPHFVELARLGLSFSTCNADEVRQFARLKAVRGLTELTLDCDALGDTAARELAAAPGLAGLHALRLRGSLLGDAGVRRLSESPHLGELRRLTLFGAKRVTTDGFAALAASPHLRNLTDLDLRCTNAIADDVRALIDSPQLPRLSRLVLNCTPAAGPNAQVNTDDSWYACPPDDGPGVLWAAEAREGSDGAGSRW